MTLTNAQKQKNYRQRLQEKEAKANLSIDILSLNMVDFFIRVTKLTPTQKQRDLLLALENLDDNSLRKIIISAGRQSGKSMSCAVAAVYLTLKYKIPVLIASAKDNYIYGHIVKIFADNPELHQFVVTQGVYEVVPKDGYKIKNGGELILLTSTEKGLRGASGRVMFLDESELMEEQTIITALGNLSGDIKLILLGTPSSKYSKFNEILKNPKKYGFTLFTWSELDCPWQKDLEDKKKLMSEDQWKREVLGELSEPSTKLLWDAEIIDRCLRNQVMVEGNGSTIEAGVDGGGLGVGNRDKLSLTIVEKSGKFKTKILLSKVWGLDTVVDAAKEIGDLMRLYKVQRCKVDSLPVYWIDMIKEHFEKSKVFSVTFKYFKEEMQGQLTRIIETQGLQIPIEYEELIQELKAYKRQGCPHKDDRVDSLMLANYSNDELFPLKAAGCGCAVFIDINKHTYSTNYGANTNSGNGNSVIFPNRMRKGLCSR